MKIAKLRRVGVYVLTGYKGTLAIKNVATGESGQYRSTGRIEDEMDALAELLGQRNRPRGSRSSAWAPPARFDAR